MKKGIIIAVIALLGITGIQAQVTFKPGIRTGLNFSHFTKGENFYSNYDMNYTTSVSTYDYKSKTDFYVGFYGALHLTKYYTLQPEINYSRQGSVVERTDIINNAVTRTSTKYEVSYLSLGILNKFTFNDKFNFHVGPTLDFVVDKTKEFRYNNNSSIYDFNVFPNSNDIDFSLTAGFGYTIVKNFGIEARVKKGFLSVYDFGNYSPKNVVFQVGATYTFDLK